jgi:hypothetical protein
VVYSTTERKVQGFNRSDVAIHRKLLAVLVEGLTDRQMLAAIGETFETAGDSTHEEPEGIVTGVIISPRPNLYVSCVS